MHAVTLGDGERVSIGGYVRALRLAMANPAHEFDRGFRTGYPTRGAVIVAEWRDAMAARINGVSPQPSERESALARFHRTFTASRMYLRERDVACLPVSRRLRSRILAAFGRRVHDE